LNLFLSFGDFVFDVGVKFVVHFNERTEMVLINLEAFFLQIRSSRNTGGNIGLDVLFLHEQR